jgi:hypothetical protein
MMPHSGRGLFGFRGRGDKFKPYGRRPEGLNFVFGSCRTVLRPDLGPTRMKKRCAFLHGEVPPPPETEKPWIGGTQG